MAKASKTATKAAPKKTAANKTATTKTAAKKATTKKTTVKKADVAEAEATKPLSAHEKKQMEYDSLHIPSGYQGVNPNENNPSMAAAREAERLRKERELK